jgi:hypothetical protein
MRYALPYKEVWRYVNNLIIVILLAVAAVLWFRTFE